jgi:hypothetical protein
MVMSFVGSHHCQWCACMVAFLPAGGGNVLDFMRQREYGRATKMRARQLPHTQRIGAYEQCSMRLLSLLPLVVFVMLEITSLK